MLEIGLYGLGRMGGNMARRLARGGIQVRALNRSFEVTQKLAAEEANITPCLTARDMVASLAVPRIVWLMLPAGEATEAAINELSGLLSPGDLLVDGANGFYQEAMRRAGELSNLGLNFADVGVSGGIWGLANGYCLMAGGAEPEIARLKPYLQVLAPTPETGWLHAGPAGSGHFTKMVHNGIEYGMMQAMAEGFDILQGRASAKLPADQRYDFNMADVAEVWRRGSVIVSWLLDLSAQALTRDGRLETFSGHVEDSGEGRWTIDTAVEQATPAEVLAASLFVRFRSRQDHTFAEKMLSAMRLGFGGHVEAPKK